VNWAADQLAARYTAFMEAAVLVVLAIVVALVAIDAIGRLDERGPRTVRESAPADPSVVTTQKIVVDLSNRG
jgi:hypothetical protein